jgi:hypothetical protein
MALNLMSLTLEPEPFSNVDREVDDGEHHTTDDYRKSHICRLRAHGPYYGDARVRARWKIARAVEIGTLSRRDNGVLRPMQDRPTGPNRLIARAWIRKIRLSQRPG